MDLEQIPITKEYIFNLLLIKHAIKNNDCDWVNLNLGYEGKGKSTKGLLDCLIIDDDFNLDKVAFTEAQFYTALDNAKKGSAIYADEGISFLFRRNAMTKGNKEAVEIFATVRERNLFFNINFPSSMLVESYIMEHRITSKSVMQKRGVFNWYVPKREDDGTLIFGNYPDLVCQFPKISGAFWNAYKKKKTDYTQESLTAKKNRATDVANAGYNTYEFLKVRDWLKYKGSSLTIQTILNRIKAGKFKIGDVVQKGRWWLIRRSAEI